MSEIYQLTEEFNQDKRKTKINATIGVVVDDKGKPYVMNCVKRAIDNLSFDDFGYLPIAGDSMYLNKVRDFLDLKTHQIQGTCGGTNALYLWAQLNTDKRLIIRRPTWENHIAIFKNYQLFEWTTIEELKHLLKAMPMVTALYQICHNPTGIDLDFEEIARFGNPVLFDAAYLGLGDSLYEDIAKIHLFKDPCVAVSFSKIMTLYQHRVGALLTKRDWDMASEFRRINSNPPAFGELIARQLINDPDWGLELSQMREMINKRRFTTGKGLYSILPVNVKELKDQGIYLLSNGRINYGGLSLSQVKRIRRIYNKGITVSVVPHISAESSDKKYARTLIRMGKGLIKSPFSTREERKIGHKWIKEGKDELESLHNARLKRESGI